MRTDAAFEAWKQKAKSVPIEKELARRGIKLKRQGKELVGPCPRCDGTDRFAINTVEQVWNCRGCGKGGDGIALVEHLDGCDFVTAGTLLAGEPPPKLNGKTGPLPTAKGNDEFKKVVAATYSYADEAGALLFQTQRVEFQNPDGSFVLTKEGKRKKTFRQRRPDPKQPGQWVWNVDGVRLVPYRLPELLEAVGNEQTILIVEGEAKVDLLRSWNVPATCCAEGAKKWRPEHSEHLRGADIVVLPDNDAAGREHAELVAASLQDVAVCVRILELPNLAAKDDVIDWAAAGHTVNEFWRLIETQAAVWAPDSAGDRSDEPPASESEHGSDEPTPAKHEEGARGPHKFPLLAFDQIRVDTEHRGYLVKGLLASSGLAVVWGPPKCGKSFWAVDVGMHIALGWEYRGRLVQQAPVVYIALEGQHGLPARIEAFRRHHNVTAAPFYLILVRLDLIADVAALIAEIKAQIGAVMPGAIFIDTLNRSLVGSESKDEDMARYLGAADRLAGELGSAVIIVHHCGIDATRPRGHTSLTGSVESQLAVKRGEAGEVIVAVEYAKDFAEGTEVYCRLEPVTVGIDPDGDEITTLIVLPGEQPMTSSQRRPVKGAKAVALELLRKAIDEAGSVAPASNHIPPNTRTISIETWRSYAYQGSITESDEPDSKRKAFVRAVKDLQIAKLIGVWGDYAWIM
ncbi:MAG: AAA family ATPase [Candidatus Binatus sp.]|jgi:hypothetical protein|uniref:AAA family ATPase n=1 Tax=Candidatus Binatus sp. TaxID=2811406 RepID=UPI003D14B8F7